ncbi:MAG TPA: cytochrome c biogenesis CcdA family protein [Actinopolymorphaceae bacterium]
MADASWGLAATAGMLAAVNPCGFALLPAYLSFLVVGDGSAGRASAVVRALVLTGAMTAGFVTVFGVFGLVIAPIAGALQQHVPWFTIVFGLALVVVGGWLLAGRTLPSTGLARGRTRAVTATVPSMTGFGASYAVASLGCTLPPFLAIVGSSFQSASFGSGLVLFLADAVGMGVVVGIAAVSVALARASIVTRLRRIGRVVPRLAGGLLVLSGAYVAYYGWYELRAFGGADVGQDPVIGLADGIQTTLVTGLSEVGAVGLAVLLLAIVTATLVVRRLRRSR